MIQIDFNQWSGKIIKRPKQGGFIDHTGIVIGQNKFGTIFVIHNEPCSGRAIISTWSDFAQNQPVRFVDMSDCDDPKTVVRRALYQYYQGKPYHVILWNCQHFTSTACNLQPKSKDLTHYTILGGIVVGFLWLVNSNSGRR